MASTGRYNDSASLKVLIKIVVYVSCCCFAMIGEWQGFSSELADWLARFNIQSYNDETITCPFILF